jgi:hypothetical protein
VETRRPAGDDEFYLRCRYRHYERPSALPDMPRSLRPLIYARAVPPLVGIRRLGPAPLRFYASADWLTLGRRALQTLLEAGRDRRLMRHFRGVAVPNESFSRPGAPHPDTLTSADLDGVLASGADFARKFDAELDSEVLDRLDERRRADRG